MSLFDRLMSSERDTVRDIESIMFGLLNVQFHYNGREVLTEEE